MTGNQRYLVRTPEVAFEIVDGEAVIIDLNRGFYYSALSTGAAIWESAANGMTSAEISSFLSQRYEEQIPGQIQEAVGKMVERFVSEQLLLPADEMSSSTPPPEQPAAVKQPFAEPVLEKHTDLEDLLRLDPIHEVSPAGWPKRPA